MIIRPEAVRLCFIRSDLWLNQYWLHTSAPWAGDMSRQPFSSSKLMKALKEINWTWFTALLIDSHVCRPSGWLRAFFFPYLQHLLASGVWKGDDGGHCITEHSVLILALCTALIEKITLLCNSGVSLGLCSTPAEIPETSIKLPCPWLSPAKFSFWISLQGLCHNG